MRLIARGMFALLRWKARKGLADAPGQGRRAGVRGETYAYWYLRRHGYVLVARNYSAPGSREEIDLVGYDGPVLAFVEVKTRGGEDAEPELAVTPEKQRFVSRAARAFLADRHIHQTPWRFDVAAIRCRPGQPPEVRLHKDAFRGQ